MANLIGKFNLPLAIIPPPPREIATRDIVSGIQGVKGTQQPASPGCEAPMSVPWVRCFRLLRVQRIMVAGCLVWDTRHNPKRV